MDILMIGAAGMIGRKLTSRLVGDGSLNGQKIDRLILVDQILPAVPERAPFTIDARTADLASPGAAEQLLGSRPQVTFHLAAIVSGDAEENFEKGYRVNLDGTRMLLEAIRKVGDGYRPRLVFTSSIAVFGAPFPAVVEDDYFTAPLTSYGTQKAICELLLNDYTRRGFLDGIGIRFPTISVRPGAANKGAGVFYSAIIREPLEGREAVLPVDDSAASWHASPRSAIGFLIHAAGIDGDRLGTRRNLTMPGLAATVGDQIAALRAVAGPAVAARIRREPNETIARIVSGWPQRFSPKRALDLGFRTEASYEDIIRVHIEDELGGTWVH